MLSAVSFADLLAPIATDGAPAVSTANSIAFWPWLEANASAELRDFNAALRQQAVRGGYRNALFPAETQSLGELVRTEDYDATRAARIRGLFLGMSPILFDREEVWFAVWSPSDLGTSQVWASHQDERDVWVTDHSIRSFVLNQYREDSYFSGGKQAVTLTPQLRALTPLEGPSSLPAGLSIDALSPRLDWVVAHFFPEGDWYGLGDGLRHAAPFSQFERELDLIRHWPHLQAYWLLHHFIFENREAFDQLVPLVERSYAVSAEIIEWAKNASALPLSQAVLKGLRSTALKKRPDLFEQSALNRLRELDSFTARLQSEAERALAVLTAKAAAGLDVWNLLSQCAGALVESEKEGVKSMPADDQIETTLLVLRGDAPMFGTVLGGLASKVDASWLDLARITVQLGLGFHEGHPRHHPGAITALGVALNDWQAFVDQLQPVNTSGRWHRLSMAVAAAQISPRSPAAMAFLQQEASRFLAQVPNTVTDTADFALRTMIREKDDATLEALTLAMSGKKSVRVTRAIVQSLPVEPFFAPVFEAVVTSNFGMPADGEPVAYAGLFARADASRAHAFFESRAVDENVLNEAVNAAGLLRVDASRARAVLERLRPAQERECGAGLALLKLISELDLREGFAHIFSKWQGAPRSKHAGEKLRAWFDSLE